MIPYVGIVDWMRLPVPQREGLARGKPPRRVSAQLGNNPGYFLGEYERPSSHQAQTKAALWALLSVALVDGRGIPCYHSLHFPSASLVFATFGQAFANELVFRTRGISKMFKPEKLEPFLFPNPGSN